MTASHRSSCSARPTTAFTRRSSSGGTTASWSSSSARASSLGARTNRPSFASSSADGWYVNLEQPQQPTALGFDYEDELLDVWVPFGGEPELLDEDELEEAVR